MAPACSAHVDRKAGWQCGACGSLLCAEECAAWRTMGQGTIELCVRCGGAAQTIRVRRAELEPFGAGSLRDAIRWPFRREGLLTAVACGVVLWLLSLAGMLGGLIAMGITLTICFHVTVATARGEDELRDPGDFRGFFEDVVAPVLRTSLAAVWAYGPVVVYSALRGRFAVDPLTVLLLLAGLFFFPMALLAGATRTPMIHLLNPLVIVGYALRLGRDYVLLSTFALAISLTDSLLLQALNAADTVTRIPGAVVDTLLLLPPLMLFRAMGMLLRARGDELGYGGESTYLVPVLGRLRPRTQRR